MIKVNFQLKKNKPFSTFEFYDSFTRIPLSIIVEKDNPISEIIYCKYVNDYVFTEFRFVKDNLNLSEITVVNINNECIAKRSDFLQKIDGSEYYDCKFVEDRSDVIFEKIDIHIFTDAIGFNWDVLSLSELIYYRIADKVYIGVDDNYYLKSFYINGLKQEDINAILGLDL